MILLASTMDGLDLSRSRVMVAAVQSLAFYCFPLLTGLLLHVMRQRDHDSYRACQVICVWGVFYK